jgi:hypothetical protein
MRRANTAGAVNEDLGILWHVGPRLKGRRELVHRQILSALQAAEKELHFRAHIEDDIHGLLAKRRHGEKRQEFILLLNQ